MYASVFVGVFCMWVYQAHHMFEESPPWTLCDWKIQDGDLCNPTNFAGFFHYVSFMCVDYSKLAYDFQLYVQRFLRFGLDMMSYLWFGTCIGLFL